MRHPKDVGDHTTLAVVLALHESGCPPPEREADAAPLSGTGRSLRRVCRETGGVYLIPIDVLPLDRAYLRVTAPQNGQRKRIRYAKDFEIARVECFAPDGA